MFTYSAVIYDGKKQNLVRYDCGTDTEFSSYLESRFVAMFVYGQIKNYLKLQWRLLLRHEHRVKKTV